MKRNVKKITVILIIIAILLVAVAIALVALVHYHRSLYAVDGPAMSPTLNSGQTVKAEPYKGGANPARGDIVVFSEKGQNQTKQLIKRVVGLPNERVTISNGKVTIYNSQFSRDFNPDALYLKQQIDTSGKIDITIPANQYFVLGDNRSVSLDSRVFGPITAESIVGKVEP